MPRPIAITDISVYLNWTVAVAFFDDHRRTLHTRGRLRHPGLDALWVFGLHLLEWNFFNRHTDLLIG